MKKLVILMGLIAFSAQSGFAAETSQERLAQGVNRLVSETQVAGISKQLNEMADRVEKAGRSELAVQFRNAAHPDALMMARTYLKTELQKGDVNGFYSFAKPNGICANEVGSDFAAALICLVEVVLSIATLGEENPSASSSL